MNSFVISSLLKMIDVNMPIIYIQDYDFVRIDEIISCVARQRHRSGKPVDAVGQIDRIDDRHDGKGRKHHKYRPVKRKDRIQKRHV